jgi:serine protease Do
MTSAGKAQHMDVDEPRARAVFPPARRLACAVVASLMALGMPLQAAGLPPDSLPELIPTLLPHVVNIAFYRVERKANGELIPAGKGLGSGYVVDAKGVIATNRHVTDGGNEYYVTFSNNLQLRATLIYRSPDIDLALLQVFPDAPLSPVNWGDSDRMRQGEQVIAIGNPLGLAGTVTTGIVSARDRNIKQTDLDAFIQVDAAINPGNSGGPLFNMRGEMVGMTTAFYSVPGADATGSIGLNFAIPGNDVQFVLNSLRAHGRVQRGYFGAGMQDVTGSLANALGLGQANGAIVASVAPDSPAMTAGLRIGDILLKMGDYAIRNLRDATRVIAASDIDVPLAVELLRERQSLTLQVRLKDASTETAKVDMNMAPPRRRLISEAEFGLESRGLTNDLRQKFRLAADATGVVLTKVDPKGLAAALGFKVGDLILRAQGTAVRTVKDILDAAAQARAENHDFMALLVVDSEGTHWATVPLAH